MGSRKVIDLECDLPADESGKPRKFDAHVRPGFGDPELLPQREGYGFDNYQNIFTKRETAEGRRTKAHGMSMDDFVARMDRAGVEVGVIGRVPNQLLAEIGRTYPGRFFTLAAISPHDGMRGVRELERLVREDGISGFRVSSLFNQVPASDRRYYPLYAKCVELDIPVRIYTAMNYANDRSYDLGHPRHLDQIAVDFPELRIVAGLSGWPWVNEMVGLLRRHPNLYCDTASHHPRYFGVPGSGWEMFLQFGNTLLQDKVMVGLSWEQFGLTFEQIIAIYEALPLKEAVIEKWLYGNAARFLRLG
jgi:predicted TIM-barrel fold metal-dependent hydrolase